MFSSKSVLLPTMLYAPSHRKQMHLSSLVHVHRFWHQPSNASHSINKLRASISIAASTLLESKKERKLKHNSLLRSNCTSKAFHPGQQRLCVKVRIQLRWLCGWIFWGCPLRKCGFNYVPWAHFPFVLAKSRSQTNLPHAGKPLCQVFSFEKTSKRLERLPCRMR